MGSGAARGFGDDTVLFLMPRWTIDWPLTLTWWTFAAAAIAAAASVISALLTRRGNLMTETMLKGSPASEDLSAEELFVLDQVAQAGGINRSAYFPIGKGGQRACLGLGNRLVDYSNTHFISVLESLYRKGCVEGPSSFNSVSEKGRALLRRDAGRERQPVPMLPPAEAREE